MMTQRGAHHLVLDAPLGTDGLGIKAQGRVYPLVKITADEMAAIRGDPEKEKILGFPRYVALDGDVVRVWPLPAAEFLIVRMA